MGKDEILRMNLIQNMKSHPYICEVMFRDSDIEAGVRYDDQAQITGTVNDPQEPVVIKITVLISGVQLDSAEALAFSQPEFILIVFKIRMHAGEREDALLKLVFPVFQKAVVDLMDLCG